MQAALRGTGEIAFLNVREEGQFGEGHPFFAVNAPYSRLELDIGALVPRLATPVVLLDEGDGLAVKAAQRLAALGYSDLAAVEGGVAAWVAAGYEIYKSVNSRLKAFAEVVEHAFHTPAIEAAELARLKDEGADLVILDSRTPRNSRASMCPAPSAARGRNWWRSSTHSSARRSNWWSSPAPGARGASSVRKA
ncbi:rhodanese-like domain-containing protein [Xanthobacter dioxanivorans]|uniref:rhodanese-like domain-containing protein n=1 Tax=Xanthobacter dioxanivorans TaxID=2528964 RepID=UPI001E40D142|nr:rhodanese-like domain-containing protein [Xanthobacter dioxanivorans]